MLLVKLDTGFNIEVEFSIPPFPKRLFAWMIDLIVIIAYYIVGYKLISMAGVRVRPMTKIRLPGR